MVVLFPLVADSVDKVVDNSAHSHGQNRPRAGVSRYFHCVETPNPAAMNPKPTTMFQLRRAWIGSEPSVT
jgi:hypothetical protein